MDLIKGLNAMQQQAVLHTDGPLLVLAGAGSGKTRVLTHRIAYLIEEKGVSPWSILAITFTNKAAAEMRERLSSLIGEGKAADMWVSTFHAMCVRILRRDSEKLGYGRFFTIYDTSDQKSLVKDILKQLNISEKNFPAGMLLGAISSKKNELISPSEAIKRAAQDYREKIIAQVYEAYQKKLKENSAMDFDDLLYNTVVLFQTHPEVLEFYQNKFRYILVDEYQDTNGVQYHLVNLLAKRHGNLCVVGDDDQSIYGWRGANIRNILDFERDFEGAKVIKLEQNYRSTQNILDAANHVVGHNRGRKPKKLWTANEKGAIISVLDLDNEYREADAIAETIDKLVAEGEREYKEFAILYRTNVQSRVLEEKMVQNSIPYRLLGGTKFYDRKEIKDLLAYLRVIANVKDDVSLKRIINVPKRGIGATSVQTIANYGAAQNMDFFEAARQSQSLAILGSGPSGKVLRFVYLIEELRALSATNDVHMILETLIERTEYMDYIRQTEPEDAEDRIANIEELVSKAAVYMKEADEPSLDAFLEEIALVAEVDNYDEDSNSVVLMTLHSAKGLEFPVVFMPGLEEGLFPSYMSIQDGDDKIEEERRLCYVGITRAREKLYMLYANQRTVFGRTQANLKSRFLKELPAELMQFKPKSSAKKTLQSPTSMTRGNLLQKNIATQKKTYSVDSFMAKGKIENLPKPQDDLKVGDRVKHMSFGEGVVERIDHTPEDIFATIQFGEKGIKKLSTRFARLKKM